MRDRPGPRPSLPPGAPPLPPQRLWLPLAPGPFRMAMGLQARDPDDMIEIDDRYPDEMADRRALLGSRRDDVFATAPGSLPACQEALETVASLLSRRHGGWFVGDGARLRNLLTGESWDTSAPAHHPLELAGRLVQEDLCLIDPSGPAPRLIAAVLCAPSRWRLREKIGRPLADVHGPVPLYAERLAEPVDRFMRSVRPGKLAERFNWSVYDDGALFQPDRPPAPSAPPSADPGRLFFRVERQTLSRLPVSGTVLFTIRVHSYSLQRALAQPGAAADLRATLAAVPDALAAYKGLGPFRDALLAYLDARA